jgi:hypothetical protein
MPWINSSRGIETVLSETKGAIGRYVIRRLLNALRTFPVSGLGSGGSRWYGPGTGHLTSQRNELLHPPTPNPHR